MSDLIEDLQPSPATLETTPALQPGSGASPLDALALIADLTPLEKIEALLGDDVVLLPIGLGEKGPRLIGWQSFTVDKMRDPSYRAQFTGNIGVLVGEKSGHLLSIDVDSDEGLESFLQLNPLLRSTLISKGSRGGNVWIRAVGDYPNLTPLKTKEGEAWGEVRSNGGQTVIYGTHPNGNQYQFVNEVAPIQIDFASIVWPEELVLPWVKSAYDELVEKEGPPYFYDDKGNLTLNDMSIVEQFAMEHLTFFEEDEQEFYQYDAATGVWLRCSDHAIKNQFSNDLKRVADELNDHRILYKRKNQLLNSLVCSLKGKVLKKGVFDKKRKIILCANGVVDLTQNPPVFRQFSPEDYSRNACPIAYDPLAKCPRFLNELLLASLSQEDISLIQRVGGAILMGQNGAQRFLLIVGAAGSGKSTVLLILEQIVGIQNVAELRTEHLNGRFELYNLLGKTLITGKDVKAAFLEEKGASGIKKLTGGDHFQAEKKGGKHITLEGNFNMVVTSNSSLRIRLEGDAGAWARRLLVIKYDKPKPEKRIADFAQKLLTEEASGILNFFIEGAMQHMQELEQYGDYQLTRNQQQLIQMVMMESDSVRSFVEVGILRSPERNVTYDELFMAYEEYCYRNGWSAYDRKEFMKSLPSLMKEQYEAKERHDIMRNKEQRGFMGYAINAEVV